MRWLAILVLVACKGSGHHDRPHGAAVRHADPIAGSGVVAELGGHDDQDELAFAITKVYEHAQPAAAPPFHEPGGTWTYFDAHLVSDPAATFGIGLPVIERRADGFGFARLWLVPTSASAGAHFVKAFAARFHVDVPPPASGTLAPMEVPFAILGHATGSSASGYSGTGTWDATKAFFSSDEIDSAEMYFNVSLAERKGVWAEKDRDYDADVAKVLAIALRDGAPPPRTPENDPTLLATAPKLELGPRIGSHRAMVVGRSARRVILADTLADHAAIVAVDPHTGATKELYRTLDRLFEGVCDDTAEHCIVAETKGQDRFTLSSDDPAKLVAVDGAKVSPLVVPGVGKSPRPEVVSRDGRYAVISGDRAATVVFDRRTKHATPPARTDSYREVIGWRAPAVALVEITDFAHPDAPTYGVWHLDTNQLEPLATPPAARTTYASPDGSRTAEVTKDGKVIVRPRRGPERALVLDARDRGFATPGCCRWIDNRYLAFPAKHFGVIDTDAMKIGFLADDARVEPVPGAASAVVTKGDGVYLARIVLPSTRPTTHRPGP